MLLNKATATKFSLECSLLIRWVILLCAFTFDFGVKAQSPSQDVKRDLNTVFESHLRKYNQGSKRPITSEEAQTKMARFFQAFSLRYSGSGESHWSSQLKAGVEGGLIAANNGTPASYNRDARSIYDAVCDGRANCAAGTDLFIGGVVNTLGPEAIPTKLLAVIFSNGHVQPGFFIEKNSTWNLHRIETTASGIQSEDLGSTENLASRGALRVLMVDDYLRMEANRINGFPAERIVSEQLPLALDRVAKNYGVPVVKLEALIQEQKRKSGQNDVDGQDGTPLAFGKADVPPGDLPRPEGNETPGRLSIRADQSTRVDEAKNRQNLLKASPVVQFPLGGYVSDDGEFWNRSGRLMDSDEKYLALEFLLEVANAGTPGTNETLAAQRALKEYESRFGAIPFTTEKDNFRTRHFLTDEYRNKLDKNDIKSLLKLIDPKPNCPYPEK